MSEFEWKGRSDPEDGKSALRWHDIVRKDTKFQAQAALGLVGFACDIGVERNKGRSGAKGGPDAVRGGLANMAWHGHSDTLLADYGTVSIEQTVDSCPLALAQEHLAARVKEILALTGKAIILGGGHETAVGSFEGLLASEYGSKKIGILNLDAHFDIRLAGEHGISSGTPFTQIRESLKALGRDLHYMCVGISEIANTKALFARADEWGIRYILDRDARAHLMSNVKAKLEEFMDECDVLYLTLDLDVLPHWQMPAVSAPAAAGVELYMIEEIISFLGEARKRGQIEWPLSDIVEFNPEFDPCGNAAKTAARLVDKITRAMI